MTKRPTVTEKLKLAEEHLAEAHLLLGRQAPMLGPAELHGDPTRCNVCGEESWGDLALWRACDQHDQPLGGTDAIVYIDVGHPACNAKLTEHPRLFLEDVGLPGSFPGLCRDCIYRSGLECEHPKLKKNGGAGLAVRADSTVGKFLCGEAGRIHIPATARRCEGLSLMRIVPSPKEGA